MTERTDTKILLLSIFACIWAFLEASTWWVAPDIAICIAYNYRPRAWIHFFLSAMLGALAGAYFTYRWAAVDFSGWLAFVSSMPFHSMRNVTRVREALELLPGSIISGAWTGLPFKLYFGLAAERGLSFGSLAIFGISSRCLRFLVALGITKLLKGGLSLWSDRHPHLFTLMLLSIWAGMILLVDLVINHAVGQT